MRLTIFAEKVRRDGEIEKDVASRAVFLGHLVEQRPETRIGLGNR